jgi:DNA (cytosine-5)-methyltransferase 1
MGPCAFVLENVPFLRSDPKYQALLDELLPTYAIEEDVFSYAEWGAATRRRRLFAIGFARSHRRWISIFLASLRGQRAPPATVRKATAGLSLTTPDAGMDHEWPAFRTIDRYADKYATGKYGWYRLEEDSPAPSFGNVMKTYTLRRGVSGSPDRAISPREAIALLGFPDSFRFPTSVPRTAKYRMAADAVSPVFSLAVARAISAALNNQP